MSYVIFQIKNYKKSTWEISNNYKINRRKNASTDLFRYLRFIIIYIIFLALLLLQNEMQNKEIKKVIILI